MRFDGMWNVSNAMVLAIGGLIDGILDSNGIYIYIYTYIYIHIHISVR